MQKNKKFFVLLLSVVLCGVCLVGSFEATLAYLKDSDEKLNTFTVGETVTTIVEEYTPPTKLTPGVTFPKKPTVKNVGNLLCYVRVRVDFSDSRMEELCEPLDIDTTNWEYNSDDGYYYYNKLLEPNDTTPALFTQVEIKTEKDGVPLTDADMKDFDILVYSESKQHEDHTGSHPTDEYQTVWQ